MSAICGAARWRRLFLVAGVWLLALAAAWPGHGQTVTPPPPSFVPQKLSKDDEQELIKRAREMGLIPPGAVLPSGIDAAALKNALQLHQQLSTVGTAGAPAPGLVPAPVAPPPSVIEQTFSRTPPTEISRDLKQFGYDVFGAPSTTFAPTDIVSVGPDYQLAPGDEVVVYVWGKVLEETYTLVVDREGKIMLPKVGPIPIAGVAFEKLPDVIKQKLGEAYANFRVTVGLGRLHSISVMVIGDVAKPGTYTVSPFATLFTVLYEAGGPTRNGSMRRVKLTRGNATVGVSDLYRFLTDGDRSQDYKLQANDVIFVPPVGPVAGVTGYVKRPAIFELAGETTAQQLLGLAGGPLPGEGHRIQVERFKDAAGRTIEAVPFKTREERDRQLAARTMQDGDLLTVYPPARKRYNFVTIAGLVPHPGDYEFTPKLTLKDLIEKAGGITPTAFLKRIELVRVLNERPAETIRVDLKTVMEDGGQANIELQEFDRVRVYDYAYVVVSGMVWNPDRYQWTKGMTVKEALEKSGGVRAGAWLKRGEIVRCRNPEAATEAAADGDQPAPIAKPMPEQPLEAQPTGLPPAPPPAAVSERRHEVVAFDVSAALAGDKEANQVLEEFDWVRIYDTADVLPETRASIAGAVYKPGTYVLTPNMSVSDLIFKAGGMKQNALTQRIELFRTELGQQPKLYILDLDPVISGADKTNDIVLADQDAVYVRRNAYLDQRNRIFLSGEVRYPGEYIAEPGERLSSILKRAGGYTEKAFLPAAVFKRVSVQELQKVSVQRFIQAQREALLREESVAPVEELTESERRLKQTSIQFRRQLLELVGAVNYPGRMVIKIDAIERMEGSRDDILIEDGDSLFIPSTPSNVQVLGAVYNAMSLIYEPGKNLDYYLAKVGGPTREADKGQIYVVKANGEVNYKFARAYPIERGDTIVVPADVRVRTDWRQLLLDTSKIIANLAIGAAVATQ